MSHNRSTGFLVVLVATLLWSTAGLFVRMAGLDTGSVVVWRSLIAYGTLGLFWLLAERDKRTALRETCTPAGAIAVLIGVVSGISYVVSLQMTTVANVMTVYAALPFIAAVIAFFAFGERATARFIGCGLAASAGVAIMMSGAMSSDDLFGIGAAFVMTAGFASSLVQAKKYPRLDMTLVTVASAGISALLAFPFMANGLPEPSQLVACALLGALTTGLANVLTMIGGRLIRSGEAGLVSLLDVPLGPLWVWIAFGEQVGGQTLLGGGIVVAAVLIYLLRPGRAPAALASS